MLASREAASSSRAGGAEVVTPRSQIVGYRYENVQSSHDSTLLIHPITKLPYTLSETVVSSQSQTVGYRYENSILLIQPITELPYTQALLPETGRIDSPVEYTYCLYPLIPLDLGNPVLHYSLTLRAWQVPFLEAALDTPMLTLPFTLLHVVHIRVRQ
jgi:hypothetical protein